MRDVSFEVKRGEVVGIPSQAQDRLWTQRGGEDDAYFDRLPSTTLRTGSTRLKVLSRIVRLRLTNVTEPTEGYAEDYRGRQDQHYLQPTVMKHPEVFLAVYEIAGSPRLVVYRVR